MSAIPVDRAERRTLRRDRIADPDRRCLLQNLAARGLVARQGAGGSACWRLSQAGWRELGRR
jgi:hypothetical protein